VPTGTGAWQQAQPGAPAPATGSVLWGRPVHVWLLVASAVAVIALLLPWYSSRVASSVSWKTTGYEYSDGSRSTWQVPVGSTSSYGGGNGLNLFTLVLATGIGGLALRFRRGPWPRWAGYTLAAITGLVVFVGLINLAFDPNLGPLLFAAAGGLAVPGSLRLLQSRPS
jgi:hypothetical protein